MRGGLVVSRDVLQRLWEIEARGASFDMTETGFDITPQLVAKGGQPRVAWTRQHTRTSAHGWPLSGELGTNMATDGGGKKGGTDERSACRYRAGSRHSDRAGAGSCRRAAVIGRHDVRAAYAGRPTGPPGCLGFWLRDTPATTRRAGWEGIPDRGRRVCAGSASRRSGRPSATLGRPGQLQPVLVRRRHESGRVPGAHR